MTAGIAGKWSHCEVVPDNHRAADSHIDGDKEDETDDGLGNQADVAGNSQTDDVLAGDTDSQTVGGDSQSDAVVGGDIQTEQYSGGEFYTVHTAQEVFGIEIH